MREWHINSEIDYLYRIITASTSGSMCDNPISSRLFHLRVISLFNYINSDLYQLNKELDISVILEGVSINFDKYLKIENWNPGILFTEDTDLYSKFGVDIRKVNIQSDINQMTDYLPNGEKDYLVTQDLIDTFKNSLFQLCDRNKLGDREIRYALQIGFGMMIKLLKEIKGKVEHPKPHQYVKVWNEIFDNHEDIQCRKTYQDWKEDNESYKFEDLKQQQTFEIYRIIEARFFRFYDSITGSDVRNRKIIFTEDNLPFGTILAEDVPAECARFEKFIEWKGKDIVVLNYEKLGKYIYNNYSKFNYEELANIVEFDKTIEFIQEDMAIMKPELAKYLKNYENKRIEKLYDECKVILNTCQKYLAKDIRPTFLQEYLKKLLYDKEMKEQAIKQLSGGSRKTYICEIVAALKNVNVFRIDCDKHDLAKALHEILSDVLESTLSKNIERKYNANEGPVYYWTKKNIEELKAQPYNPFEGII